MTDMPEQWEELPVAPLSEERTTVQWSENRAGQQVYRHVFYSEWRVVPNS